MLRQPDTLRAASESRSQATLRRIEQALAYLDDQQKRVPRDERVYTNDSILAAAAALRPDLPPIHRSTLLRNVQAKALIAAWQRREPQMPDFDKYGGWQARPRVENRHAPRYANRLRCKSVTELAERVVGLEDLLAHCLSRREAIEQACLIEGTLLKNSTYPLEPFIVSPDAPQRYQTYVNSESKSVLIRKLMGLETAVQEHQQHLLEYDREYVASVEL